MDKQLREARHLLHSADALLISAGAGMGVDSGLPDFRGDDGMWQHYPALGKRKMRFTSIANPQAFEQDPSLAWGFYGHRLQLYRSTIPHAGFQSLLKFGQSLQQGYFVFTSNVDGQFQKAGFDSQRIYECHGSIHFLQCMQPCKPIVWSNDHQPVIDKDNCQWLGELPKCPHCQGLARPNILMFGDWQWLDHRYDQQKQRMLNWLRQVQRPVVIEIGAGSAIPTVRHFSEQFAPRLIRINPTEAYIPRDEGVSLTLNGLTALEALLKDI